jgi:hypothetical protein
MFSTPVPSSQIFFCAGVRSCQGVSRRVPGGSFFFASAWAATPLNNRRIQRGISR